MNVSHIPHVVSDFVLLGFDNMLFCFFRIACGFVPQTNVKMCVKQPLVQ